MEKKFDFWQEHSIQYLEMAFRTDRRERVANPDGYGKHTGTCGDSVEIFLTVGKNKIQAISYEINGCLNTNACANTVADLAIGKTIEEAWEITPEKVVEYLGTLPSAEIHCAEVAAGAFYLALANCKEHSVPHDPAHAGGNNEAGSVGLTNHRIGDGSPQFSNN